MPSQQVTTGPALMEGVERTNVVVVSIIERFGPNILFFFYFSFDFILFLLGR